MDSRATRHALHWLQSRSNLGRQYNVRVVPEQPRCTWTGNARFFGLLFLLQYSRRQTASWFSITCRKKRGCQYLDASNTCTI